MRRRILVVEDSPTQAERVRLLLEREGYRVEMAENGRAALQRVRLAPPDLIISDVVMPEMDGYALCRAVYVAIAGEADPGRWIGRALPRGTGISGLAVAEERPVWSPHLSADLRRVIERVGSGDA